MEHILQKCDGRNTEIITKMYNGNQAEIYVIKHIIFLIISFKFIPYMHNIAETAKQSNQHDKWDC